MQDETLKQGQNTGVVVVMPDMTKVWFAGAETGVAKAVLEESCQYDQYLPDEEAQNRLNKFGAINFDALACVTFSALNSVEILFNRMRAKGLISAAGEKFLKDYGYINPTTNKVNFSDRFNAKLSGTTRAGNNLQAVADSIRNDGLVPENVWPFPAGIADIASDDERWNLYYAAVPQSAKDLGAKFKALFGINTQWVVLGADNPSMLKSYLKYGPLQLATLVCSPWNSNEAMPPIPACGCGAGHAHTLYGFNTDAWKDFDHYKSFRKLLALNYCIPWAMQYYVTENPKKPDTTSIVGHVFTKNLKQGDPASDEVKLLQMGLQYAKDKNGKPYMTVGTFGPFGPQTMNALGRFQTDNGITDPDGQGTNFGPKSRSALTLAVSK